MKKIILFIVSLISIEVNAQVNKSLLNDFYDGEIIDSTITKNISLYKDYYPYYYQFDAKYPESSSTLLSNCQSFLRHKHLKLKGNGYITFNFMIDNDGKINFTKFTQIDENYKPTKFNKKAILKIYDFVKSLDNWKKIRYQGNEELPISYITFMSFKIENAKITNIIP